MTGPRLKESGPELTEVRRPRLTRGATPPALCAASFGPSQGVSPYTFYRCTGSHGPVDVSNVACFETRGAESCTRRAAYVERLWSGSCSPRRAFSAQLQAQCRPSVSPVGQSLRAVGRSGVARWFAPLCFRCSAPLRVQQPAVFTATAGLCLLCCLTNSDGCALPLCRGWLRTRTSSCSVDGCSHDGGLLPRRAGARTELSGRTHDTAREGRPARGRSSARQNPARRCCSRQVDTNCARPACCTAAARAPTYATRVPGCRSALLSRWSRLRAGYARARRPTTEAWRGNQGHARGRGGEREQAHARLRPRDERCGAQRSSGEHGVDSSPPAPGVLGGGSLLARDV